MGDFTTRQLIAMLRVVRSMNLVQAQISVEGEKDLLSRDEMLQLELELMRVVAAREGE
jgi:hypothetical protein